MRFQCQYILLVLLLAGLAGCAEFKPLPMEEVNFLHRAETKSEDNVSVTIAIPTIEEAQALFDSLLHEQQIQPIWIKITNSSSEPALFYPYIIDPDYFTPLEVAWQNHRAWAEKINQQMDEYFLTQAMPKFIASGKSESGFVFVHLDQGTKYVPVRVLRQDGVQTFEFFIKVPGLKADYEEVDFDKLYTAEDLYDLNDEEALRKWVEALPCCTQNKKGTVAGDPINFVLIGSTITLQRGFFRVGWDETAVLSAHEAMKTAAAAIATEAYRYAPISPLYFFNRTQDIALQKARQNVHQRNHLRLWLAPVTYRGVPVWVGQISRDIGSRLTSKSSMLVTHKIDPDLDDSRDVLILDLYSAGVIDAFGYATGVGEALLHMPRKNLTGDPYFTDGLRAVIFLLEEPEPREKVRFLKWTEPK